MSCYDCFGSRKVPFVLINKKFRVYCVHEHTYLKSKNFVSTLIKSSVHGVPVVDVSVSFSRLYNLEHRL